ncbi:MAG: hypothetical protein C4520_16115 [Candidatus Abyssobacteria bacterium SURF_5]|uniref:Fibronectin type-III domain-containing protein n=1 Tax=Abyssobacteria bacterium (strain SURF_5) TaxID=2093360 RepID=A0A3A4NDH6_ABYX5|nr:MAG: hypothetical protein C4520_16115 [Candidatus Abyssubacteria bacterium SURF_5]
MRRNLLAVISLLVLGLLLGTAPAAALEHILGFDDLAVGTRFRPWSQPYSSLGITINGDGYPTVIDPTVSPCSPPHALYHDASFGSEFGSSDEDLTMEFDFTSDHVIVYVGLEQSAPYTVTATLRGYRDGGALLIPGAVDSVTMGPGTAGILNPLVIHSDDGAIDSIVVSYGMAMESELIDCVHINVWEGPPPPPPDDLIPPSVVITAPADLSSTSYTVVNVSGYVDEDVGLTSLVVSSPIDSVSIDISGQRAPRYIFGQPINVPAGSSTIRVTAEDGGGNVDYEEITINCSPLPPPPSPTPSTLNIRASGMEVTQAIQGWDMIGPTPDPKDQQTNMVTGKKTLVRVYGVAEGTAMDISGVGCMLRAYRLPGVLELPGSPIFSNRVMLRPGEDYLIQRTMGGKSFNFILPDDWTTPGTIRLEATVNHFNGVPEETGAYDYYNSTILDVQFHDTEDLCIRVYRLFERGGSSPTIAECDRNMALMRLMYPVNPERFSTSGYSTDEHGDYDLSNDDDLAAYLHTFSYANGWQYGVARALWCDNVADLGLTHHTDTHRGITHGDFPVSISVASDAYNHRNRTAHEIGHAMGLGHILGGDWCDVPAGPYEPYPIYTDQYGMDFPITTLFGSPPTPSIGDWGAMIRDDNTFFLRDPGFTGDMMSYCDPDTWISGYTWNWLFGHFHPAASSADGAAPEAAPQMVAPLGPLPYFHIGARIMFGQGMAWLKPVWTVQHEAGTYDYVGEGEYSLSLEDGNGNLLFRRDFDPTPLPNLESYALVFEILPGIAQTEIVRLSSAHLAQDVVISAGIHPPDVKVIMPNGGELWNATGYQEIQWSAKDEDGDPLTYAVMFSNDKGLTWDVIGSELTATGMAVPLDNLSGGGSCLVRVLASDGIHQGEDVSDGLFSKGGQPPHVSILVPDAVTTVPYGEPVILEGLAWDREDGTIPEADIRWESNLDGPLGTGQVIGALGLQPGMHEINFKATDSDNMTGADSASLYIAPRPIVNIKANNSDGPVTLSRSNTLNLSFSLDNGGVTELADWWLFAQLPNGKKYYYTSGGWKPTEQPARQSPLVAVPSYNLAPVSLSTLPLGKYVIYCGTDLNPDGKTSWEIFYYDSVTLELQP